MELVEASIRAKGHQRWIETITRDYRAKLRILRSKRAPGRDQVLELVEVTVDKDLRRSLLRDIGSDPEVKELAIVGSSRGRVVGLIRAKGLIMRRIADSDCFLVYASNVWGRELEWRVVGTEKSLRGLLKSLTKTGVKYQVVEMSQVKSRRGLTPRREWLLRTAFERGYFDYPKGTHVRALARELGVSAPTLFESLKKAQRKVLEEHFHATQVYPGS